MSTATKERPILFSGPMVRAILDDRKTQTRRVLKPQPSHGVTISKFEDRWCCNGLLTGIPKKLSKPFACPHGEVGDRLWVREAFYIDLCPYESGPLPESAEFDDWRDAIYYRADGDCCDQIPECECATEGKPKWRPSIHMPRWASRITLEITGVRVERLNDISEEDAIAEGVVLKNDAPEGFNLIVKRLHGFGMKSTVQFLGPQTLGSGSSSSKRCNHGTR